MLEMFDVSVSDLEVSGVMSTFVVVVSSSISDIPIFFPIFSSFFFYVINECLLVLNFNHITVTCTI